MAVPTRLTGTEPSPPLPSGGPRINSEESRADFILRGSTAQCLIAVRITISILNYVARRTKRAVRCSTRGHRGMPRRFRSKYHGVTADGWRRVGLAILRARAV